MLDAVAVTRESEEGREAFAAGDGHRECPYPKDTLSREQWLRGWWQACNKQDAAET